MQGSRNQCNILGSSFITGSSNPNDGGWGDSNKQRVVMGTSRLQSDAVCTPREYGHKGHMVGSFSSPRGMMSHHSNRYLQWNTEGCYVGISTMGP